MLCTYILNVYDGIHVVCDQKMTFPLETFRLGAYSGIVNRT